MFVKTGPFAYITSEERQVFKVFCGEFICEKEGSRNVR